MKKLLSAMMGLTGTMMLSGQAVAQDIRNPAAEWEELWDIVIFDITIIGVIMAIAAVFFLIRYRANSPDQVGSARKLTTVQSISFALIPAAIFMADDFYLAAKGWTVWNAYRNVPEDAMEVKVTAYQWYFEFEYPDGTLVEADMETPIKIPVGQPVVFRMTSEDVIHSFGLPHYRVKEDIMPGRQTYVWINPIETQNTAILQCAEFCGEAHSQMANLIHAVPQEEYDAWIAEVAAEG
ncbi:MAG: cytochrome c oxidase subunit II [Magnetovibrio sp.]|nr:cytochrome c oxidase subunit II [Magnetovibrio sp.]